MKKIKPVRCYAWFENAGIAQVFVGFRTVADVVQHGPNYTGGSWIKVLVTPIAPAAQEEDRHA